MAAFDNERFADFLTTMRRNGALTGEGYDPGMPIEDILPNVNILCVGAGGIGCELLHAIAVSPLSVCNFWVVDMDTIDLTNLNRQFLFRMEHINKSKCEVAVQQIKQRFPYMKIEAIHNRIENLGASFYRSMHVILLGLDSITARQWANSTVCTLYHEAIALAGADAPPAPPILLLDGGTEAYKGSVRRVDVGTGACLECLMYQFPAQKAVPLCTLENIPRNAAHCVLYVSQKSWEDEKPFKDEKGTPMAKPDGDDPNHILWIAERAEARRKHFKIDGECSFQFTQGVVKNVVPAVGFSNALVAATMVNETLKIMTGIAPKAGSQVQYDGSCALGMGSTTPMTWADEACKECSPRKYIAVSLDKATFKGIIDAAWAAITKGTELEGKPLRQRLKVNAELDFNSFVIYPTRHALCIPPARDGLDSNTLGNSSIVMKNGQPIPVKSGETVATLVFSMLAVSSEADRQKDPDNAVMPDDDPNDIFGMAEQRVMVRFD